MSVINMKFMVGKFSSGIAMSSWKFDSFVELASKPRTEIAVSDGGYSLYQNCEINRALQGQVPSPNLASLEVVCAALKTGERVVLSINEAQCFTQQIEVPTIAIRKIASILDFELSKTTPFAKEQIYMGWQRENSKGRSGFQNITQFVMRRDLFVDCIRTLSSKGSTVRAIVVRRKDSTCAPFALSLNGKDYENDSAKMWSKAALVGGIAVTVLVIVLFSALQKRQIQLSNFIDTGTKSLAKDAANVRKQIDRANAGRIEYKALFEIVSTSIKKSRIIEEISRVLTNDSYLDGLTLSGNIATLDGAAAHPESLIALLEASPLFSGVAFNTPSFRNPGEEKTRFSIKFEIVPNGG